MTVPASLPTVEVHVTDVRDSSVYGHRTTHCDEAGCAGYETFLKGVSAAEVEKGRVYTIDNEGAILAEVE